MATLTFDGIDIKLDPRRKRRIQPRRAWVAMGKLLQDKEDTRQAFEIVRALSGKSLETDFRRFMQSETGRNLFRERKELVPFLSDYDALSNLPDGSFGRAYLDFVTRENISALGLVEESEKVADSDEHFEDDLAWYGRRLRDTHDLWHVLTGYGRDGLGEMALLAFSHGQSGNFGLIFMAFMASRSTQKTMNDRRIRDVYLEAKQHGRRAAHLSSEDYVKLFGRQLHEVRESLGIRRPKIYEAVLPDYLAFFENYNVLAVAAE